MKNIHLIKTDNPNFKIFKNRHLGDMLFHWNMDLGSTMNRLNYVGHHLYITSEESVKERDWLIVNDKDVMQMKSSYDNDMSGEYIWVGDSLNGYATYKDNCKKIILTTDPKLIENGVRAISEDFIEWFCKNPSCKYVTIVDAVECLPMPNIHINKHIYKIILPQEPCDHDFITNSVVINHFEHNYNHLEGSNSALESFIKSTSKQEIVGYRLKPHIDRMMVDGILKHAMPIWNEKDKSVYFIRGHVAGCLVLKLKELQVLDVWFTPIYENEEIKSDWVKQSHLDYYYRVGLMKQGSKLYSEDDLRTAYRWGTQVTNGTKEHFQELLKNLKQ